MECIYTKTTQQGAIMMKKLSYKVIMISSLLTGTTVNIVAPMSTFAKEMGQIRAENEENINLAVSSQVKEQMLEKAALFAQAMNVYSRTLLNNPEVDLKELTADADAVNLSDTIKQDQIQARGNATSWNNEIKRKLIETFQTIITYDMTFQNYYRTLSDAAEKNDAGTLKEGIKDLQDEIKEHKETADGLIKTLQGFQQKVGHDARNFQSNWTKLQTLLTKYDANLKLDIEQLELIIEKAKPLQEDINQKFSWYNIFGLGTVGGIDLFIEVKQLDQLRPLINEYNQKLGKSRRSIEIITVAYNNVGEMHKVITNAVDALQFMSDQWQDLDSQYGNMLNTIEKADKKITDNKFSFLQNQLDTAKDQWATLHEDAAILKEGIKELKIEPIKP